MLMIEGLELLATIGVFDWEQQIKQKVVFDIQLELNLRRAGLSDDLADTVDYDALCQRLTDFVAGSRFFLIEALAERSARLVLETPGVEKIRLKLSKPGAVALCRNVCVVIERGQERE